MIPINMVGSVEGKQLRIAVVGPSCIGKTCIVKRFTENSFHGSTYGPTAGVDFMTRRLVIKPIGTITLIIQDIAGSALTSKMINIYLHGVDIFLLTYDMTNATTLTELRKWIEVIKKTIESTSGELNTEPSIGLIGSKGDLEHLRAVRLDGHTKFVQEHNIPLSFLVSAKSGESVFTCFSKCALYHLNPDAKNMVKEHNLAASTSSTAKKSLPGSSLQNHPQGMQLPTKPPAASDPNSAVCTLQ